MLVNKLWEEICLFTTYNTDHKFRVRAWIQW